MKAYGSQIIAEFISCRAELLNHREALEALLVEGIERHNMCLKSINSFQFEPVGVTAIAIIGESHVAIHTYPEERHLSLDIFTCSPGSPHPAQLLEFLRERLEPELVRSKTLTRGQSVELTQADYLTDFSRSSFDIRYHISRDVLRLRTDFQQLAIIDNPDFGRMLFLDHELQIASADAHLYHAALLAPLADKPPGRVAVLGGGDGGVLKALLALDASEVHVVDIDDQVVTAAREHLTEICAEAFADPRAHLQICEAGDFLTAYKGFDLIVCDLTTAPERLAHAQRDSYFPQLFRLIRDALNPGGLLSLQVGATLDRHSRERAETLLAPYFSAIQWQDVFIPSFCESWLFASARL